MIFERMIMVAFAGTVLVVTAYSLPHLPKEDAVADTPRAKSENYRPIVVLELFTSQGCSSCPPADALLDKVKKEPMVFALSYHVDHWNYVGWIDSFSNSKYTEKQREYNIKLKNRGNYTPELIVNGKDHFVGSDASKVDAAIQKYSKLKSSNKNELYYMCVDQKRILFKYSFLGDLKGKKLRAVLVLDQRITEIKRGENRNRTLTNSNIVVAEKAIKIEDSEGKSFLTIPEIVAPEEKISLILMAENSEQDITGAAKAAVRR